jgi:DNA-binding phage protein
MVVWLLKQRVKSTTYNICPKSNKGMTQISRDTGLGRESLYKALSVEGNPGFATILKVFQALGLRLQVTAIASESVV